MDHIDSSWCYVCAREIMPKRFLVPVAPPPPPSPAPPPSSPSSSPSKAHSADVPAVRTTTRTKSGRARGGLVHGTGRVKPNGAVKRSDSVTPAKPPTVTPPTHPLGPQRHRTIIDQGPIPLYCSDECWMSDMYNNYDSHDIDPHRESLSTPPVPHNSYTSIVAAGSETESDSSSGGSSVESHSSMSWSSESPASVSHVSPSIATLAALYSFPPLPPPAPIIEQTDSSDSDSAFDQYQSGVMMAARRIKAALCPEPPKRSSFNTNTPPAPTRQPIPGWTDGSDAWRSSVYSLSSPANAPQYPGDDKNAKAYKSTVASPHRSRGVHSTLGDSIPSSDHSASTGSLPAMQSIGGMPAQRSMSYADELYSKYPLSSSRRSESRTSLVMSSSPPKSSAASARSSSRRRQEKSLLKPGAEGKLLVPDVKMRAPSLSQSNDSSYDAASLSSSWRSGSSYPASSRRSARSPLSRYGSEISEGDMLYQSSQSNTVPMRRPCVETRSWSYDNLVTYPVMPPIPKKEKRIQRQVVDGEEQEVEVEVEITQPLKRLFLFSGKEASL